MESSPPPPPPPSWSIHTRREITTKYAISHRIGSGAYSDVYLAHRRSDSAPFALKEIHDYQSAFREIEALQILHNSPNVVVLHEYFWRENEDAVLVLEYLPSDLGAVIEEAKKRDGLSVGQIKRWMVQILCGVDACHRNSIVHRDLKPSNLLIAADGTLKLADFGQARILLAPGFVAADDNQEPYLQSNPDRATAAGPSHFKHISDVSSEGSQLVEEPGSLVQAERTGEPDELRSRILDDFDKDSNFQDGDTSCLATGTMSNFEEDLLQGSYSYDVEEGENDGIPPLTSCVGTRWYRAPELLYGSTSYGPEIDLWSLGCIFAELLSLAPLFPGNSDIDQIGRIFNILGNLSEEVWPGCANLPDYKIISFNKVDNPVGLEASLPNRSSDEILLVKKLLCYDPAGRATAMELLHEKYLNEEPLPVPLSELRIPPKHSAPDKDSPDELGDFRDFNSDDSDFDDFGPVKVSTTDRGFSIQFS